MKNGNQKKNQITIMIADDDPAILDATTMILEDEGYQVKTAADGEAISQIKKNMPDLLLLDIWMSGQDGRDICRDIKSNAATKHIPVIMISANRDTEKIAREAGAEDFIAKPFDIDYLLQKVRDNLS